MKLHQLVLCVAGNCLVAQVAVASSQTPILPPPPPGQGDGMPPPPGGMPPPRASAYKLQGTVTLGRGRLLVEQGHKYLAVKPDMSAVFVKAGGRAELRSAHIETRGNTSSDENSSFFGLNAGVLVTKTSSVVLEDTYILTTGRGANALFTTGKGASLVMRGGDIVASGDGAHGVMATLGGEAHIEDVRMRTSGAHAAPIATDRGGGCVSVHRGTFLSSGEGSPGIYSTGDIRVSEAVIKASGAEGAVIEGQNHISLENTQLAGEKLAGVMIYQSFSGDAQGHQGHFSMRGGSLVAGEGPLFFVTNAAADIELEGVQLTAASGVIVKAGAARWGQSGSNGGEAHVLARNQVLKGDLLAETGSSVELRLTAGSHLLGRIEGASLDIDASSHWEVGGPSFLKVFSNAGGIVDGVVRNVVGNGYTVHYESSNPANLSLGGKTYQLAGGGVLMPN